MPVADVLAELERLGDSYPADDVIHARKAHIHLTAFATRKTEISICRHGTLHGVRKRFLGIPTGWRHFWVPFSMEALEPVAPEPFEGVATQETTAKRHLRTAIEI